MVHLPRTCVCAGQSLCYIRPDVSFAERWEKEFGKKKGLLPASKKRGEEIPFSEGAKGRARSSPPAPSVIASARACRPEAEARAERGPARLRFKPRFSDPVFAARSVDE